MKIRNRKKGFTLVELIVVLVIIAILAAITVPTMSTYIDKANEKKIVTDARSLFVAAQTIFTEAYAAAPEDFTSSGCLDTVTVLESDDPIGFSSIMIGTYDIEVFDENKFVESCTATYYYTSTLTTYEAEIMKLAQLSVSESEFVAAIQFNVNTSEIVSMYFVSGTNIAEYKKESNTWNVSKAMSNIITGF
ncbi:MAG: type II secretion system protein [Ruminococcaceae bacterium]|nr:type II secretion system protein [Oscillospiraceae bacterium]